MMHSDVCNIMQKKVLYSTLCFAAHLMLATESCATCVFRMTKRPSRLCITCGMTLGLAYVTISNRPLDAAKSNRAVNVYRSKPSQQDQETLASSFLSYDLISNASTQQTQCIRACCIAYDHLCSNTELNFGRRSGSSRDLHHFFKYLNRCHRYYSVCTIQHAMYDGPCYGTLPPKRAECHVLPSHKHAPSMCVSS